MPRPIDVLTEIEIARPMSEVAAFAADPDNATRWYKNISSAEWVTPPPLRQGSRIAFVAHFLGKTLRYTYEIIEHSPSRFVMRTAEGPFPMETTYEWDARGPGHTVMRLRNRGQPSGFAAVFRPLMAMAMRRENRADLRRLKGVLETT